MNYNVSIFNGIVESLHGFICKTLKVAKCHILPESKKVFEHCMTIDFIFIYTELKNDLIISESETLFSVYYTIT